MLDNTENYSFLKEQCAALISGCRLKASDGTWLYTPDGISSYNGLWTRDFAYMVEYAGFCIPDEDIIACVRYIIAHRRGDGWMPDRVTGEGLPVYAAGILTAPVGEANLDNTPFLIFLVHSLFLRLSADAFRPLFEEWERALIKGLFLLERDEQGLVWNDPIRPHSPYGFTDTVAKTGSLFMESLLYWRACRFMEEMYRFWGPVDVQAELSRRAERIEQNISFLRDPKSGAFFAASQNCRQLDIWGMAYLIYIDFPYAADQEILDFLVQNCEEYLYKGQVRHLLAGEYWERLLIGIEPETYQNGAYWATATGWVLWCFYKQDPHKAFWLLGEVCRYFQTEGFYECVNRDYQKLPSFVVSAANVFGGCDRILKEKNKIYNQTT